MRIKLHILPGKVVTWDEFIRDYPTNSIALDGFVHGGPKFDPEGRRANFNHHEEVSRLETRATCAQVLIAIRQGLMESFKDDDGNVIINVYVNDCDEDVCLSVFMIKFYYLVEKTMNPLINQLSSMEDILDTTAGAYAFPRDLPSLRKLMWVFDPYHRFRSSGALSRMKDGEYQCVISDVSQRIHQYLVGNAESVKLDTTYEVLNSNKGWQMVREIGPHARLGMFADGIRAFISVRQRGEGVFDYTLGRMSKFIPFNLPVLYSKLNELEKCEGSDRWGGSDTVGGSPRSQGSRIQPAELAQKINEWS